MQSEVTAGCRPSSFFNCFFYPDNFESFEEIFINTLGIDDIHCAIESALNFCEPSIKSLKYNKAFQNNAKIIYCAF